MNLIVYQFKVTGMNKGVDGKKKLMKRINVDNI